MLSQIPWSLFTYFFLLLFRLNFNGPISSSPTLSSACLSVLPILGSKMAHEEAPLSCPSCGSIKNNQVKNKKLHWTNTGALGNSPRFTAHQGDIKSGPWGKRSWVDANSAIYGLKYPQQLSAAVTSQQVWWAGLAAPPHLRSRLDKTETSPSGRPHQVRMLQVRSALQPVIWGKATGTWWRALLDQHRRCARESVGWELATQTTTKFPTVLKVGHFLFFLTLSLLKILFIYF